MPMKSAADIKIPIAEIIAIGDEMTGGARVDTNTAWLAEQVERLGVRVAFHSTVGDNMDENLDVFRHAAGRADIVVVTGGLGPTRDDLTREVLGQLSGQPMQLDRDSLKHIETLFTQRKRAMPERNQVQAMFPAGSRPIFNPQGTAPGVDITIKLDTASPCRIFALPGVPAEMKRMFVDTVGPAIADSAPNPRVIRTYVMKLFGVGESDMEAMLGDMISRTRSPRVGITVSTATISLRITATCDSKAQCDQQIEATRQEVLAKAGEYHFGDGESFEQQDRIAEDLVTRQQTIAIVEAGHGAPLANAFSALPEPNPLVAAVQVKDLTDLRRFHTSIGTANADDLIMFQKHLGADWLLIVDRYPFLDHASTELNQSSGVKLYRGRPDRPRSSNDHAARWTPQHHPSTDCQECDDVFANAIG